MTTMIKVAVAAAAGAYIGDKYIKAHIINLIDGEKNEALTPNMSAVAAAGSTAAGAVAIYWLLAKV